MYLFSLGGKSIGEILSYKNYWLSVGVANGLILIGYLMMYRVDAQNIALNENDLEDTEWLSVKRLKKLKEFQVYDYKSAEEKKDGIVIGAEKKGGSVEVITTSQLHALIVGTTGSGKTTGFVDQNIAVLGKSKGKPSIVISDPKKELYDQINEVRKAFERTAKTYDVRKVQQHLTEYHPVSNDFYGGKSQMNDTYERVWAFYDAIERINEASDVTRVSWPMWIASEQFGLFEPYLAVNPVYHALWAYGRLPVTRVKTSGDGNKTAGVMAGADSLRAGAIVYNRALKETQTVTIDWKNLPFEAESCTVYGILPDYYVKRLPNKTPEVYLAIKKPKNKGGVTLEIPVNGAYYIEFNTAESKSELDKTANIGQLMKKEYCYTERGDGKPFADVFNGSFAAYLGMLDNDEGEASVAVITSGANKLGKLDFAVETYGELAAGENAALGVRVDYHTADGFVKSVKIAVGGFTSDPELPFGTREKADESHIFGAGGKYSLDLNANAPENWDGIIEISYFIKNAGSGALAKFTAA